MSDRPVQAQEDARTLVEEWETLKASYHPDDLDDLAIKGDALAARLSALEGERDRIPLDDILALLDLHVSDEVAKESRIRVSEWAVALAGASATPTQNLEGDPVEVQPADLRAESQSALNGPSGSPTSPSERASSATPEGKPE